MPDLPVPFDSAHSRRSLTKAVRLQGKYELAIHRANLEARYRAAVDEADAHALADVIACAGTEEIDVLERLLSKAGDSPAAKAMVARLCTLHSELDNRRIARRFGE